MMYEIFLFCFSW